MIENKTKRAIAAGRPVMAMTLNFVHAGLAEYCARLGFDCLVVDGEHGVVSDDELENVVRSCELAGATSLLRLPVNDPLMQRYLGLGIAGFHVPQVRSVEQAQAAIDAIKFAPTGHRGLGSFRAGDYGLAVGAWPDYMKRANDETLVVLAVEDPEGIAALPAIVKLPAVDVIMVGTSDLSASMGLAGQTRHPDVLKATNDAVALIRSAGKTAGLPASSVADINDVYERGARFILTSIARVLPVGSTALLSAMGELAKVPAG